MDKVLDLSHTIYALCQEYPGLMEQLRGVGFARINPAMLATAGRFMTIPKGAAANRLPLTPILNALREQGYTINHEEEASHEQD